MRKIISIIFAILLIVPQICITAFASAVYDPDLGIYITPDTEFATCAVCNERTVVYERKYPTCQEEGYIRLRCHEYTLPKVECDIIESEMEATCTELGKKVSRCLRGCGYWETIAEIPVLGHRYRCNNDGVEPTCTESGYTSSYKCTRDGCGETIARETIPASGHTRVYTDGINPTCMQFGLTKGSYCLDCGRVFEVQNIIKATGHNTKTVGKKSATYFAKGHTGKEVCKNCGEIISKGKAIPKLKLKTPKATVKVNKKKITVKYRKVKDAKGFEVKYKYKSKVIKKSYNTQKAKTIAFKNLKKGTYKVYVRAFTKHGTKKAYSNWTQVKTVKVK